MGFLNFPIAGDRDCLSLAADGHTEWAAHQKTPTLNGFTRKLLHNFISMVALTSMEFTRFPHRS